MLFFSSWLMYQCPNTQRRRNELFSGEARKISLLYIQDAKNFSVVKPLNSGEAVASPVPPPLWIGHSVMSARTKINKSVASFDFFY